MDSSTMTVLDYFNRISAIPRCSKDEGRIRQWLQDWAVARGLGTRTDAAGNLVVRVPAGPGGEGAPTVVIQSHMDMVCEKTPDSPHDFSKDPIRTHMEADWLTADRTTLGADNGIAIAYSLALVDGRDLRRPPLELLFTVDEETGLNGVKSMDAGLISGKYLINLDSEDEGVFTIGCAGGADTHIDLPLPRELVGPNAQGVRIVIGGLTGGHSGIDIHKQRANANKLLARVLDRIQSFTPCRLLALQGGTRHNAIPRDATAVVAFDAQARQTVAQAVATMARQVRDEYGRREPALSIETVFEAPSSDQAVPEKETRRATDLLLAMPHGVAGMSMAIEGLVETSSNLATVDLKADRLTILSSQRSAIPSRLEEITAKVHAAARLAGAEVRDGNHYPPWQPVLDCELLKRSKAVYQNLYGQEPVIQVIHAGLECAIIGDLYPGMRMISFGPTIRNPHSPSEKMHVPSVEKVWQLLVALLDSWTAQG